jgi:hypothetical protein
VLFLDCDGVIGAGRVWAQNESKRWTCPAGWLDPVLIARLNRLVRRTGAAVVLSTSWRRYLGRETVADILRACGFTGDVIGATEVMGEGVEQRHREVERWVREHPGVMRWVAIDDCEIELPAEHFVRTHAVHGLTDADCDRAVAILANGGARG